MAPSLDPFSGVFDDREAGLENLPSSPAWTNHDEAVAGVDNKDLDAFVMTVQKTLLDQGKDADLAPSGDRAVIDRQRQLVEQAARMVASDTLSATWASASVRESMIAAAVNDIVGAGPIDDFFRDPAITEIICRWTEPVRIEKNGLLQASNVSFRSSGQLRLVAQRMAGLIGRYLDEQHPHMDGRTLAGDRIHAVIPPLCPYGPVLTIRKFPAVHYTLSDMVRRHGAMTFEVAQLLGWLAQSQATIAVVGGTSTGKTTFMRALMMEIPPSEYVITIEDTLELGLEKHLPMVTPLEARRVGLGSNNLEISIRHLVADALRMRPDRICVGEARGGEAFDLLDAASTGHEGTIFSVHANSPEYAVTHRIPTLVGRSREVDYEEALRMTIASVEAVIFLKRYRDSGKRLLDSIHTVDPHPDPNVTVPILHPLVLRSGPSSQPTWQVMPPPADTRIGERFREMKIGSF